MDEGAPAAPVLDRISEKKGDEGAADEVDYFLPTSPEKLLSFKAPLEPNEDQVMDEQLLATTSPTTDLVKKLLTYANSDLLASHKSANQAAQPPSMEPIPPKSIIAQTIPASPKSPELEEVHEPVQPPSPEPIGQSTTEPPAPFKLKKGSSSYMIMTHSSAYADKNSKVSPSRAIPPSQEEYDSQQPSPSNESPDKACASSPEAISHSIANQE